MISEKIEKVKGYNKYPESKITYDWKSKKFTIYLKNIKIFLHNNYYL